MNANPIGIFDSGVGGLSILKEINKILPNENTIYLADNKNCPYGNQDTSEIIKVSLKNTSSLIKMNCKMVVLACNTATTNAVNEIRKSFTIPIIGIEPAIKPAIMSTKTNKIGVLATERTLTSNLFNQTSYKFSNNVEIYAQIGNGLEDLVEKLIHRKEVNVIVIDTDPDQSTEEGGTWWDVAIPEVSKNQNVKKAFEDYSIFRKKKK